MEKLKEQRQTGTGGKTVIKSGVCGKDLTWTLDEDGSLTISGEGEMDDYFIYEAA